MLSVIRRPLSVCSVLLAFPALAGPVNSSASFPAAGMNPSGDSVWAGDERIMVYWKGTFSERRYAIAPFRFEGTASDAFSVGIADPSANPRYPVAIACSESRVALFVPQRVRQTPSGTWLELPSLGGISFAGERLSCAMRPDGSYSVYLAKRQVLLTSGGEALPVGELGRFARLVSAGSGFVLLGSNGKLVFSWPANSGKTLVSSPVESPFGTPSELTRFAGSAQSLLRADADAVQIAEIIQNQGQPALARADRLPVSPCEESQACGVSLASDNSWMVSGYWGTFLGTGKRFVRLSFPNLSRTTGGVAFSHSGRFGSYVYVGNDDGDMGILPETAATFELARAPGTPCPEDERYAVWHRPGFFSSSVPRGQRLFPWKINRKINGHIEQFYENEVTIHTGPVPEPIPRDWVAWELQEGVDAPPVPRGNSPLLDAVLKPFEDAWWLKAIRAKEAVAAADGLQVRPVVVSLVDSGAQMDHPWLRASLLRKVTEVPGNGIDDDGNGFVDDVSGWDFVEDDNFPNDQYGHGTHVAGLVGAREPGTGLPLATNGYTWLRVLRALDAKGKSNSIDLARAISYAVTEGTDILNCSWGGGPATQVLRDAFAYAEEGNVLVISSAGNDRLNTDLYPQVPRMFPGVISVAATNRSGSLASFSNWGPHSVAWAAPGQDILSTLLGGTLGEMSGTSMAAPIATNVASFVYGIVAARNPGLTRLQLKGFVERALCESAAVRMDGKVRCGQLDAAAAVNWVLTH